MTVTLDVPTYQHLGPDRQRAVDAWLTDVRAPSRCTEVELLDESGTRVRFTAWQLVNGHLVVLDDDEILSMTIDMDVPVRFPIEVLA